MSTSVDQWLATIFEEVQPLFGKGRVADYIPALARVTPNQFGMSIAMVNGRHYAVGDAHVPF